VWDFAGAWDAANAPWAGFHANSHNDGLVDSELPTAITGASFAFDIRDGAVELLWGIPPEAGSQFDVSRARVDGETTGDFVRIADDVRTGAAGELRLVDGAVQPGDRYLYRIESVDDPSLSFTTVAVYVGIARAELGQNYPNPFNPTTTIEYLVPDGALQPVSLVVYDVTGARVRTLVDAPQRGGRYAVEWDGRNEIGQRVSSGVYFYRLVQPGFSSTRKMVVLK
jgi:hypothetical protein